jgi:hypothetical protein
MFPPNETAPYLLLRLGENIDIASFIFPAIYGNELEFE